MKLLIYTLLPAVLFFQNAYAQSAFNKPADAIKYRQGAFQVMGFHSQRIGGMVKGEKPFDRKIAENDAAVIALMATQLEAAFPAGSDIQPSKAKPGIWEDPAQFKKKMDEFNISAQKLSAASRTGDINALRAAFLNTAQSCKSCHDDFRNR